MNKLFKTMGLGAALLLGTASAFAQGYYTPAEEIELGKTYASFTWDSNNLCPGTCLKFTAPSNGKLSITQAATYDGHMYTKQWTAQPGWNIYDTSSTGWYTYSNQLQPDKDYSYGDTSPYTFDYSLVKGQEVFFYARIDSGDPIKDVSFKWSGEAVEEYEKAQLNVAFNAYKKTWEYTPTVTGVMTVKQTGNGFTAGSDFSFVYTNPALNPASMVLPNYTAMGSDNTWKFNVVAGTTYYFNQSIGSGITFTILSVDEQANPLVTLVGAQPAPGEGGLDDFSYVGGISINLAPATGVGITSASFQYVTPAGQTVSKPVQTTFNGGGNWTIEGVRDYYIEAMQGAAKPASMCKVVLQGLTVNGVSADAANDLDPTYVNCNGSTMEIQYYIPDEYGFQASKIVMPDVIYSKYEEGQSNGIATLIFNNNIKAVNQVSMVLGTHTWGAAGGEAVDPTYIVPYEIDNNTLTLDFTQAYLDPEMPSDSNKAYTQVTVFINGIMNEYGILWGEDGINTMTFYQQWSDQQAPAPEPTMEKGIVLSPVDGNSYAIDTEFKGFLLEFYDAEEGGLTFGNPAVTTVPLYVGGNEAGTVTATIDGNRLSIGLGEYAGKNAEYMVWLDQGFVRNAEGVANVGQGVSCKVLEMNPEYVLSPVDGAELADNVITVTYANSTLLVNETCPTPISWANNRYMGNITVAGDKFEIPLDLSVMEAGTYTLEIPATYFVINAASLSPVITASYIVTESGVTANFIQDENGYTVYNMNGVKVMETTNKANLNSLGKGLYIINGKKVLVK